MSDLESKERELRDILAGLGRVAVAFSGGVDSALLAKVSHEELGTDTIALIADIPMMPRRELASAVELCDAIGIMSVVVALNVLDLEAVRHNRADRCYACKSMMLAGLLARGEELGFAALVDGSNGDDAAEDRPGARALDELGVRSPLREAGFSKADVRALAKKLGLTVWDKPSSPCMATRFPRDMELTLEVIALVEAAEQALHDRGFRDCRVRVHGEGASRIARIEVPMEAIARLTSEATREAVVSDLGALGFRRVCVDLEGYGFGSMDA